MFFYLLINVFIIYGLNWEGKRRSGVALAMRHRQ